ncbi:hypothetical protein GCM10018952_10090 [Streptosporangium vulgare]
MGKKDHIEQLCSLNFTLMTPRCDQPFLPCRQGRAYRAPARGDGRATRASRGGGRATRASGGPNGCRADRARTGKHQARTGNHAPHPSAIVFGEGAGGLGGWRGNGQQGIS